jgi:hypothetical protein
MQFNNRAQPAAHKYTLLKHKTNDGVCVWMTAG